MGSADLSSVKRLAFASVHPCGMLITSGTMSAVTLALISMLPLFVSKIILSPLLMPYFAAVSGLISASGSGLRSHRVGTFRYCEWQYSKDLVY